MVGVRGEYGTADNLPRVGDLVLYRITQYRVKAVRGDYATGREVLIDRGRGGEWVPAGMCELYDRAGA